MFDGTTMKVNNLVRKIAILRQRSPSIAVAAWIMQMLVLRGFKEIPWNEKRRNLVKFFFSETMLLDYSPFSVINHQNRLTPTVRTVRKIIKNPEINRISNLTTISSSITLRAIKKFSNCIIIQAPSYSISEACDSSQDYSEESTGETTIMARSKRNWKILAPSSVLYSIS